MKTRATAIPSCSLTERGLQAQRVRLHRLGASVAGFERDEDRITIEFEAGFDQALLDETVATERACCPFFRFEFDPSTRKLAVRVEAAEHRPGLDALAYGLAGGAGAPTRVPSPEQSAVG